jgi:hypothetical protein
VSVEDDEQVDVRDLYHSTVAPPEPPDTVAVTADIAPFKTADWEETDSETDGAEDTSKYVAADSSLATESMTRTAM